MIRRTLGVLLVGLVVLGTLSADESATLWGYVLDRAGQPAPGYAVVIEDAVTGVATTSAASNSTGLYEVSVPVGGSYRSVAAISRSGARFGLDAGVAVQARRPVRYRLDVILPSLAPPSAAAEPGAAAPPPSTPGADSRTPWWKSPAGIIGLVAVQGAILAVIFMDDDEEQAASPSTP